MNIDFDNVEDVTVFSGEPPTTSGKTDDGKPMLTVRPHEYTPEGIKRSEGAQALLVLALVVVVILSGGVLWWAAILLWMLLHGSVGLESGTYATKTEIVFTPDDLFVRQDGGRWRRFDRSLTHRFAIQQHDNTRDESESRDLRIRRAQARGETINPRRYYADSYHVVLQYVGHRHDLLTVYDKVRAMAVLARLKACDAEMDKKAGMGGGDPMEPKDQWGDSPGDLPG